jgi:diamine N-acetyltransferase
MTQSDDKQPTDTIELIEVCQSNWRDLTGIEVAESQKAFVAEPCYYLAMCCYGQLWSPLAISLDGRIIGMMMWAVDPDDRSCWLGGIMIDRNSQCRGLGERAVRQAIGMLSRIHSHRRFALSYSPDNHRARRLYQRIGFVETGEMEGDEIVARLDVSSTPDVGTP